jgi:hypothetical protein
MLIRTMTGKENWKNHSAKLQVFYSPTTPGGREIHIGVASRDPTIAITQVRSTTNLAKPGFRPEIGEWTDASYEVPPGTVLKLFANKAGGFGAMNLTANVFVCTREDAALNRVKLALSSDQNAYYSSVYVQGKFDILSYDDARIMGAKVMPQFKRFAAPEMVRRLFEVEVLEPQTRARPTMTTETVVVGTQTVNVPIRRRGRIMPG